MLRVNFFIVLAIWCLMLSVQQILGEEAKPDMLPSVLLDSVVNRDLDGIGRALENGENIDLTNDRGWSAARFAVAVGDMDVVRELIDRGIDLNNPDAEGVTPLMAAASAVIIRTYNVVKLLMALSFSFLFLFLLRFVYE